MTVAYTELLQVERRRKLTIVGLAAALFLSTMPIVNERALFRPLADGEPDFEAAPKAYAIWFPGSSFGGGLQGHSGGRSASLQRRPRLSSALAPGSAHLTISNEELEGQRPFELPTGSGQTRRKAVVGELAGTDGMMRAGSDSIEKLITTTPGSGGGGGGEIVQRPAPAIPEPATWLMMISGIACIASMLRRAHRARKSIAE